jgi:hypothetical protein
VGPGADRNRAGTQAKTCTCRLCEGWLDGLFLELGVLPVCNRFTTRRVDLPAYALSIACCGSCGLIQLVEPPPMDAVMPQVPWIRYNEPDGHLDDLVDRLLARRTGGLRSAFGVGPFEGPLLERLAKRGFATRSIDLLAQAGEPAAGHPYLESWQARLRPSLLDEAARIGGEADIVSCRYLLEHCCDPLAGLQALARLLSEDGLLVVEVPDSSKFLAAGDYCFLWEEHVSYFVEATFAAMAASAGFEIVELIRYPGQLEDALVGLLRPKGAGIKRTGSGRTPARAQPETVHLFARYRDSFPAVRAAAQARVAALAGPARDGVALFGAGHQAVMFVNALGLGASIGALVDDDPNKRGRFAPGIDVPIISSAELMERGQLRACLLAVSPRAEAKVREKLAPLAARGVAFHTIYAGLAGSILTG